MRSSSPYGGYRRSVLTALLLGALGAPLGAAPRTFVSAVDGLDVNPCTRQSPCRNFTTAIAATDPGGEVVVLDSGGYGPATITKSVALIAPPGVHAAVTAFAGNGITVAAGAADVVTISGLQLTGLGGVNGIQLDSGGALHVERVVLTSFQEHGLITLANAVDVYVTEAVGRHNQTGFRFFSTGIAARATLRSVRAEENDHVGVLMDLTARVTAIDSVAVGHPSAGFWCGSTGNVLVLERCTAAFNNSGIISTGTTWVSNCVVTGNSTGVMEGNSGGSIISVGNNLLSGNVNDGVFTSTVPEM